MKGSSRKLPIFVGSFLLVVISCAISLVFGEIYFRVFKPQSIIPRYVETSPYGIRKNIAAVRGKMITSEYRHGFDTNSQGFRGFREYSLEKPSNVYRIIALGDSVTLGHGVEDDETFCAVLEKRLSQIRPTEVINMGVSGFGTAEELIQLRNIGFKYNPDLVILAYFPNDPYNNIVSKLFKIENGKLVRDQKSFVPATFIRDRLYKIPGYSFLSQHSHLLNFVRSRFSAFFIRRLGKKHNVSSTVPTTLDQEQTNLTASLLNEIIAEVGKCKLPLVILNIPNIHSDNSFSNLPCDLIDINTSVQLVDVDKQIYSGYSRDDISYKKDCHPKPFGHKLKAEWLESFVKEKIWQEIQ
jgi:hypothetical protein